MRRLILLLCLVALGQPAALSAKVEPITKAEARSLSEAQVKRRVWAQLADILREHRLTGSHPPPVRPLTDLTYFARSRATLVPGLCAIDELEVRFEPEADDEPDQDTPARANSFEARHFFSFRQPPRGSYDESVDYERRPVASACAGLDLFKDSFFRAPDAEAATDGYRLATRAIEAAQKGAPPFALICEPASKDAEPCGPVLAKLDLARINYVEPCAWDRARGENGCTELSIGDISLRIVTAASGPGEPAESEDRILRVTYTELIIIADSRVD